MTHEDVVYDRRVRLLEYAAKIGNVAEACRVFGVSRKTYHEWVKKAEQYGLSARLPKERGRPHQPNAMSSEEVSVILAEASPDRRSNHCDYLAGHCPVQVKKKLRRRIRRTAA